ncbi:ABC transporter ATP-binding protein [Amphibacillus cookii]|uniref:ABC transporter ATP-binding protein n=1 Tax=Amphibacillus cookii TaxID=767787 RepID=UPI00195908A7|nr:ABC transporter ATP-binding protein [Amphibacillus cookii]MBM7541609.1 putative ABC transport system ATP-binding protein [Amphibacillus cookii]
MITAPLALENVTKAFKDGEQYINILEDISFTAEKGKFTAVIGPSGSGKSTFLSIAGALLTPDQGEVFVNSQSIASYKDKKLANVRLTSIGYIFQAANLVPYLKVNEQLKLVAQMKGDWDREAKQRLGQLLESVGLKARVNYYPHQLSGGEKQRVAIARAFMNNPDIILADEPTANLDQARSDEIVALMAKEVKEKDKAAVMVTHDESLLKYCDTVYRMEQGKLIKGR